jgi:hypothetical protein
MADGNVEGAVPVPPLGHKYIGFRRRNAPDRPRRPTRQVKILLFLPLKASWFSTARLF